jgi:hypothetical protein
MAFLRSRPLSFSNPNLYSTENDLPPPDGESSNTVPPPPVPAFDEDICKMVPDFEYVDNGEWIVEGVQSEPAITPTFLIKLKLSVANFPSVEFRIVGIK